MVIDILDKTCDLNNNMDGHFMWFLDKFLKFKPIKYKITRKHRMKKKRK